VLTWHNGRCRLMAASAWSIFTTACAVARPAGIEFRVDPTREPREDAALESVAMVLAEDVRELDALLNPRQPIGLMETRAPQPVAGWSHIEDSAQLGALRGGIEGREYREKLEHSAFDIVPITGRTGNYSYPFLMGDDGACSILPMIIFFGCKLPFIFAFAIWGFVILILVSSIIFLCARGVSTPKWLTLPKLPSWCFICCTCFGSCCDCFGRKPGAGANLSEEKRADELAEVWVMTKPTGRAKNGKKNGST